MLSSAMARLDLPSVLAVSALLRVVLIVYGEWQDKHMEVRYTDVDYLVFSDGAALMASKYRYSPLLAFLLLTNALVHPSWGKILFSTSGSVIQAAFWYGVIVHFRIYPIIDALPIILLLDPRLCQLGQKPIVKVWSSNGSVLAKVTAMGALKGLFSKERIAFGLISALVFFSLTGFSIYLYKWEFFNKAVLYHLSHTDPRDNFSIILLPHRSSNES